MPWIERGGIRAHYRGADTPEAREVAIEIVEAMATGAYCDLATREEHHPTFARAYERARAEMGARLDDAAKRLRPVRGL